jgi:hypothetical protein
MLLCPDKMKISKLFFAKSAMVIAHWSDAWFDVDQTLNGSDVVWGGDKQTHNLHTTTSVESSHVPIAIPFFSHSCFFRVSLLQQKFCNDTLGASSQSLKIPSKFNP